MTAIIGFGLVGQAVYASLKDPYNCIIIDPKRGTSIQDDKFQRYITNPDSLGIQIATIIICLPTPTAKDGSCDISIFNKVYSELKEYTGLVIIKSTVPKHLIPIEDNWVYNPEFLNANTSITDFINQKYIVLGGEIDWVIKAVAFYKSKTILKSEDIQFELCSKDEASDFKYIRNIYQAYKVLYWEMCEELTGNSRKLAQMLENIPMGENTQVGMDGFRGFGGACLPKDLSAFQSIHKHELLDAMIKYNQRLNN